jgi:hypothetical protein
MSTIPEHNVYDYKVTEAWEKKLAKGGYEPPPISLSLRIKIAFFNPHLEADFKAYETKIV